MAPKRKIYLEENESIEFVENEKMYSSKWNEDLLDVLDYGYGEEVIVRDLETGKILERYKRVSEQNARWDSMAYDRIELEKVSFNLVISINLYGKEKIRCR